jgi:hypothetical protein
VIALDVIVLALATAIFVGTLRLGKRQKSENSATTRSGEP